MTSHGRIVKIAIVNLTDLLYRTLLKIFCVHIHKFKDQHDIKLLKIIIKEKLLITDMSNE